jgi:hypothetical protein
MRHLLIIPIILASLSACKATPETTSLSANASITPQQAEVSAEEALEKMAKAAPGDIMSPFNKDGSQKPDFPGKLVLHLNDIVRQTYNAIERYDKERKTITATVDAAKGAKADSPAMLKAKTSVDEVQKLLEISRKSKADLGVEGIKLLNSKEYYNIKVFSGMALFIDKVEKELTEEVKLLNDKLKTS